MKYRIPLWDKKDRVVFIEMEGTGHPQEREGYKQERMVGAGNDESLLANTFPQSRSGQLY